MRSKQVKKLGPKLAKQKQSECQTAIRLYRCQWKRDVFFGLLMVIGGASFLTAATAPRPMPEKTWGFGSLAANSPVNLHRRQENASAGDCFFGFTGRPFDKSTGLQYNGNRWYDPSVGRWLSEDPIGFEADDPNLYRYVNNQPTIFIDPSGFAPPKPSPKFQTPTNPPQYPPEKVPNGWRIRTMPPTEQYPEGYWRMEKPMPNGGWQGIDPSSMKPGPQPNTHIPLPNISPESWADFVRSYGSDVKACAALKCSIKVAKDAGRGEYAERLTQLYVSKCFGSGMP